MENYRYKLDMSLFEHIPQISQYNHNYYKGFGNDLLFGESDDDQTTEWFLVNKNGAKSFVYIGCTYGDNFLINVPY